MKVVFLVLMLVGSFCGFAQDTNKPRKSPLALTTARYKNAYIKIIYGQPAKNGRDIFGSLVPFGQVWRTGANEATEMTLTKDIYINGTLLKAGTYSIFTIPEKIKWTIIINSEVGLWGSYNYNEKLDVLRFDAPVQDTGEQMYESFTMALDQNNDKVELDIMWDRTKISIPIRFSDEN